jgi:hypothetical protein
MTLLSPYLFEEGQDALVNVSEIQGEGKMANDSLKLPYRDKYMQLKYSFSQLRASPMHWGQ